FFHFYVCLMIGAAVISLIVALYYCALLRRQEFFADWVSASRGFRDGAVQYLSAQPTSKPRKFSRLFSLHPSVQDRLAAVTKEQISVPGISDFVLFGVIHQLSFFAVRVFRTPLVAWAQEPADKLVREHGESGLLGLVSAARDILSIDQGFSFAFAI